MKCPVCSDATLVMTDRQGVEIDYCPECRGVWLDRGELDKIIERAAPEPPRQESRGPRDEGRGYGHHDHHRKKKKHSLLSDLFDF